MAAKIAAAARPVDYPDRTSEAARDQGWGPVDSAQLPTEAIDAPDVTAAPRRRLVELPGKNGRNNWYNQSLTSAEAVKGMSAEARAEQAERNKKGAAMARLAMEAARRQQD